MTTKRRFWNRGVLVLSLLVMMMVYFPPQVGYGQESTEEEFAIGDMCFISSRRESVHVHETARINDSEFWTISPGDTVEIIGGPEVSDSFVWWRVKHETVSGWVIEPYLSLEAVDSDQTNHDVVDKPYGSAYAYGYSPVCCEDTRSGCRCNPGIDKCNDVRSIDKVKQASLKLETLGYHTLNYENIDAAFIRDSLTQPEILFYFGHGQNNALLPIDNNCDTGKVMLSAPSVMSQDSPDLRFVFLLGCETGQEPRDEDNILHAFYHIGPDKVIGMKLKTNVYMARSYSDDFWTYAIDNHMEVSDAARLAYHTVDELPIARHFFRPIPVVVGDEPVYLSHGEVKQPFGERFRDWWDERRSPGEWFSDQFGGVGNWWDDRKTGWNDWWSERRTPAEWFDDQMDNLEGWWDSQWQKWMDAFDVWLEKQAQKAWEQFLLWLRDLLEGCCGSASMVLFIPAAYLLQKRKSLTEKQKRLIKRVLIGFGLVFVFIIMSALIGCTKTSKPVKASKVAPVIVEYAEDPDQKVTLMRDIPSVTGDIQQYEAVLDNGDEMVFDVNENGDMVGLFRENQRGTDINISEADALATARAFAQEYYSTPGLVEGVPDYIELMDTIADQRFYAIQWGGVDPDTGAVLPQLVYVEVNAVTGQVDGYAAHDVPVTVELSPEVTYSQANQIALDEFADFDVSIYIEDQQLGVTHIPFDDPDAEQVLVWYVWVTTEPDEDGYTDVVGVVIDAQTAEVLHIEPYY